MKSFYLAEILLQVGLGDDHLLDPDPEALVDGLGLLVEVVGGLVHGVLVELPLAARRYSLLLGVGYVIVRECFVRGRGSRPEVGGVGNL